MPGTRKLGRTTDQRRAMLRQLVTDLLDKGRLETTYTRAKEVSAMADKMITLAVGALYIPTQVDKSSFALSCLIVFRSQIPPAKPGA